MKNQNTNLIQTKFFKPKIPSDFIRKDTLLKRLDQCIEFPLTMVSAPAGYGKSLLVSDWLDAQPTKNGWLSLGEEENTFGQLAEYLISAIKTRFSGFGNSVLELIHAPEPVPASVLMKLIINEISLIDHEFILVLDDYHFIRDPQSHELLETWLKHPSHFVHIIIICRSDPPIPISKYRQEGKILEIRVKDLEFTTEDTSKYFKKVTQKEISEYASEEILKIFEGWISGLKMLAISIGNDKEIENIILPLNKLQRNFLPQLIQNVLENLDPTYRKMILALSIVKEFNIDLCEYLIGEEGSNRGRMFIQEMERSNLFIIPLDDQLNWYRFHHLFADLLLHEIKAAFSEEMVQDIQIRAAEWFDAHKYYEQAIFHFTKAGEFRLAENLLSKHRISLLNKREWIIMERILTYFPENYISDRGSLLLLKAWLLVYHGHTIEMFNLIESVREIIETSELLRQDKELLLAECDCLVIYKKYFDQDYESCLKFGENALQKLPVEFHYPIGYAWVFVGGALQVQGRTREAITRIYEAIDQSNSEEIKNMALMTINYLYLLEGNIGKLKKSAIQLVEYGKADQNMEAVVNGNLFSGMYYYSIGDLKNASDYFKKVLKGRYHVIGIQSFFGITALIYTYLYSRKFEELDEISNELDHIVNEAGGQIFRSYWDAYDAEIKMFRSQKKQALNWLKNAPEFPLIPITNHSDPNISIIRILLMEGSSENLTKAKELMDELGELMLRTNNRRVSAIINVGEAIYFYKIHDFENSVTYIRRALEIAELGNNVMVFVEYGQPVVSAIKYYINKNGKNGLLTKALELILAEDISVNQSDFTQRELEIIPLLSLPNKEIARKLFIAEKTVKRHSNSIFKKLHVKNRREAFQKAAEMKLM